MLFVKWSRFGKKRVLEVPGNALENLCLQKATATLYRFFYYILVTIKQQTGTVRVVV